MSFLFAYYLRLALNSFRPVSYTHLKKLVKDILELNKGSIVVLDKLAGEQVDLFVNGQCIAKGDVVVVDDNFGIRITQILSEDIPVA